MEIYRFRFYLESVFRFYDVESKYQGFIPALDKKHFAKYSEGLLVPWAPHTSMCEISGLLLPLPKFLIKKSN